MVRVSRNGVFRCIEKQLGTLWAFTTILCLPTGVLASVEVPCDLGLNAGSTSFTLQLHGGGRVTRDIAIPAHSEVLVTASETELDVALEASGAGRVIGRTATPVNRTGIARLMLETQSNTKVSLIITAKGDPGVRGLVVIRTFSVNKTQADTCWHIQRLLAAADSHYAQAQAGEVDKIGDSKIDVQREYKTAADQYITAASHNAAPALQAYAELSAATVLFNFLADWTSARSWAQAAARKYRHEGELYDASRARSVAAEASMEIALRLRSTGTGSESTRHTATALRHVREEFRSLATFHALRGELFNQAEALVDIERLFFYEGMYEKSIASAREALSIFERLDEKTWSYNVLLDISSSNYELGRVYDAAAQSTRLLQVMPKSAEPLERANLLYNSANCNLAIGHMDAALRGFSEGLQLARLLQNDREQGYDLFGIGAVYASLGDLDRALEFYRQSLSLLSAKRDVRGRMLFLRRTGSVLRSRGLAREALSMHDEALSLAQPGTERTLVQIQRARDLEAVGQNHSALQILESIIRQRGAGRKVAEAQALLERAKIRLSTGELSFAEVDLHTAITIFAAEESPVDEFLSWVALAQTQHKRGSTQQALDSLDHALKLAEEIRLQSANPEFRASLLQPLRPAFDLKITLLAEQYFAAGEAKDVPMREQSARTALSTAERSRARAFADFERLDVGRSPAQARLLEQRRAIYHELSARHFQLESSRERMADDDPRVRAIRSDITGLRVKLDETNAQLNASTSAAEAKADSESWTLDRRKIPADTAIVEYWLGDKNAIAWVATGERLTMVDLGASMKITDAAHAFHDSLRAFGKVPVLKRLQDSARLYALVIRPLERYISPYHTLLFAPDGALHYIPFGALRATDRAQFVIENHDIAETPSIRILLDGSRGTPAPHFPADRLLLVADPIYTADDNRLRATVASLKTQSEEMDLRSVAFRSSHGASLPRLIYTAREAASVASLFAPDRVDRLEGFAATKDRFLAAPLDRYRVIHVASHAMADAQIMGLSALALSAFDPTGRKLDNLVFAADFATLRLNADLVVLSACDTSLGKDVDGEGLMGLRYITLARGAKAVVASLWEVPDDATADLMTAFYRTFLRDHKTVTAALSDAKRRMLRASNADPSGWGSFTAAITTIASRHER